MADNTRNLRPRDRAFAELARARGWVDDAALDRAMAESSTSGGAADLERRLLAAGLLSEKQVESLWEAVDGIQVSKGGGRTGSWSATGSDATLRPESSSDGATLKGPASSSGATIRANSKSAIDPEATLTPASPFPSRDSEATLTPSAPRVPSGSGSGSLLTKSTPGEKAKDRFGPYKLMRELGRGGMGVVYRAMHVELRREVALKVMLTGLPEDDPDTERFRREAGLVARVGRHPNLVAVHEIGREDDRLYFTMDYIEGRSARQRIEDEGAFPPREAAALCADIAAALEFVHKAGVLHRDVKPHNVLIDRAGRGYLSDFGLAKSSDGQAGLTVSGAALGTPSYMAPEIAARGAKTASPLSDVYSLGATLFEMLTARPPFTGLSGIELIRAVAENDPPSPLSLRPDLHPDLDVICEKAMEKDPARRFASAADMERDLRRFVNGEPIHARPIGRWDRLKRKARRNSAILATGALALAVLATVGAWSGTRWWKKEQARQTSENEIASRKARAAPLVEEGRAAIKVCDEAEAAGRAADGDASAAKAADVLARAVDILPADAEARFLHGQALRRAGKPLEALDELEKAVDLSPNHSLAWFEHGLIAQEAWLKVRGTFGRRVVLSRPNEFGYRASSEPTFLSWISSGKGKVDRPWKEIAAKDFERVVATGAAKELGAYGRAMLLYLDGKYAEALREMDAAVEMNPYFAPALVAEAEMREFSTQDAASGLEWRRRLHEVAQPQNPVAALDYAVSLAAVGRGEDARVTVVQAMEHRDVYLWLAQGSWTLVTAGAFADAEVLGKRALAAARTNAEKMQVVNILREACLFQRHFDQARALLDEYHALFGDDPVSAMKAQDFAEEGNYPEALVCFRAMPEKAPYRHYYAQTEAWAEWICGNIHSAKARLAADYKPGGPIPGNLPIIRLDLGEIDEATAEFETLLAANRDNSTAWSNLAGAQFLKGDYNGAVTSLEEAFVRAPVPASVKEQVKPLFVNIKKRAGDAKTPAEAGKVVESIAALATLAVAQGGANVEGAGAGRDALRALWWELQEFYWRSGMPKESIAAGARYLALRRHGNVLFKQARAYAARGKTDSALNALREAMEQGFDEAKRLDEEKAFDAVRQLPGFVELRGKCR